MNTPAVGSRSGDNLSRVPLPTITATSYVLPLREGAGYDAGGATLPPGKLGAGQPGQWTSLVTEPHRMHTEVETATPGRPEATDRHQTGRPVHATLPGGGSP